MEMSWQGIRLGRDRERGATVKREQDVNQCGKYDKKQLRLQSNSFSLPCSSLQLGATGELRLTAMQTFFAPSALSSSTRDAMTAPLGWSSTSRVAPNHYGLTTLSRRNRHGEALCSFACVLRALLAWLLGKKSLSGKLDQALLLQSLLSQDKRGWEALLVFPLNCPFAWALSWENARTQH